MRPRIFCIILGGGRGTRLYPLTQPRCKPAVPLAGKYRLVDIPISNCLNSGLNEIYVLTQFNTASLHRHIQATYSFDPFGGGLVDIMSAEQTEKGESWYQGTADAVRQNLVHFHPRPGDLVLILSGDQLYRMDFRTLIDHHRRMDADATIAATPVPKAEVSGFGLMQLNDDFSIRSFIEKPTDPAIVKQYLMTPAVLKSLNRPVGEEFGLASMGIYLFKAEVLVESLASDDADFGKEVIPGLLGKKRLSGFVFDGYWEDIGTVKAFFECNLNLTEPNPSFDFFHPHDRIYTRARYLPASRIAGCTIGKAIIADGCILKEITVERSVIGVRSVIGARTKLKNVVIMGNDYYENELTEREGKNRGAPPLGIGSDCEIEEAIIDKNARIGNRVKLNPNGKPDGLYLGCVTIRDGVLVVPKEGAIPDDSVL